MKRLTQAAKRTLHPPCAVLLALLIAMASAPAWSQVINSLWLGDWQLSTSNQTHTPQTWSVSRADQGTVARSGEKRCTLAYDGRTDGESIQSALRERETAQLDPKNWAGASGAMGDNLQLVGLRREFERAMALAASIPRGPYRRVRLHGPGCDSADDVFFLLSGTGHTDQRLFRFSLPAQAVGVEAAVYTRPH